MILKQSFKNHLIVAEFTLTTTLMFAGAWWYFEFDPDFLLVIGIFQSLFTIPALYLHIEYYLRNRGEEIEINADEIIVRKNGKEIKRYSSDELEDITVYKSASLDKGGIPLSALESYHFARILAKNKDEIIITCLLAPKRVEQAVKQIQGVEYFRFKTLFATLRLKW